MNPSWDMPQNYYFGGAVDTLVTPLGIFLLFAAMGLLLALPRKHAIVPFLAGAILLPNSLKLVVGPLHVFFFRLLLLSGFARWIIRRDLSLGRLNVLDKVFIGWAVANAVTFSILWHDVSAVLNRLGFLYVTLGSYLLLRVLIRDKKDAVLAVRTLAWLLLVIAPFMLVEHLTGRNWLSLVGAQAVASVREGHWRAAGPFGHAIIAGSIAAMLVPLFIGLWFEDRPGRKLVIGALLSALAMIFACSSSTPFLTIAAGVGGFCLWRWRAHLRLFRWGLVLALVALQLIMKAPVWFLLSHLGGVMGGSGWHRAMLIDNFVRHFSDWWLVGTQDNAKWGFDMWDSLNAFANAGIEGGLLTFALFIGIFVYAFRRSGIARRRAEKLGNPADAKFVWGIGCCVLANAVAFFGITYFDQSVVAWYALLVLASIAPQMVAAANENLKPIVPMPAVPEADGAPEPQRLKTLASMMR